MRNVGWPRVSTGNLPLAASKRGLNDEFEYSLSANMTEFPGEVCHTYLNTHAHKRKHTLNDDTQEHPHRRRGQPPLLRGQSGLPGKPSLPPASARPGKECVQDIHTHTHLAITLARRHENRSPSIVCSRIALESVSANGLTWDLRREPAESCQREVSSEHRAAALPSTALADKTDAQFWLRSTDQT